MKRTSIILAAVLAGLLSSPSVVGATEVPLSADAAFVKAARALLDLGALPTTRDKELLFIKSDAVQIQDAEEAADCGKLFGLSYTRDKRTKVAATYQVMIKPVDASRSDVSLIVTLDGYMDTNEGAPFFIEKSRDKNKALTCRSTGALERQFFKLLGAS